VSVPAIPAAGASPGGPAGGTAAGETAFDVTPESTGGAVWGSGSGPSIGPGGAVFVTTGNPDSGGPSPWAESVVKLGPDLGAVPLADYRDRLASGDLDLSTGGALVLADGDVFAAGKTDTGYVLRQRDLSLAATIDGRICGSDPDGGAAFDDALDSIYLPCMGGGIQQVRLSDDTAGWRAGSVNSTVVLAGGDLWALGYPGGTLEELDAASGAVLYRTAVGRTLPHFASLTIVDGLLLVPTTEGIMALDGPAGPPAEG
jgi:polyvinyl alcohol dehydrogenase (cytochrome)